MNLLVVLQNPWARGKLARGGYHPATWRKELEASRTGRRLRHAIPSPTVRGGWQASFVNASPVLAKGPDGRHEASLPHLRRALRRTQPDLVLACGLSAEEACRQVWAGPLICVPHPAYRLLTNKLYDAAREMIATWGFSPEPRTWKPRVALRQLRGRHELVELGG